MNINSRGYSNEYLNQVNNVLYNRMDGNNGEKDGKITIDEVYKDLNVGSLFDGLKEGSYEYNRLKSHTDKIAVSLFEAAGDDHIFDAEEYAKFLNGEEWGNVLDAYKSSSSFSKIEMSGIENSRGSYNDGKVTKGEVKVGIMGNMKDIDPSYDTSKIEKIIDNYAGEDGIFTVEEYTTLKNDKEYKTFLNQYNVTPYDLKEVQEFDNEYLDRIEHLLKNGVDGNNGEKDGKITIDEVYKNLDVDFLLNQFEKDSPAYNVLKSKSNAVPEALLKYAGSDGVFSVEEYAKFLNGEEWGKVINSFRFFDDCKTAVEKPLSM